MKINQLANKPQLIQVTLDDNQTVELYGEPIEFWTWDRQPLDVFMKLASVKEDNPAEIINLVRTLILDEQGNQIVTDDQMLPGSVLVKAISKVVEILGKF
jgi:hypothetical protein